jgi:hypothetical protein
MVFKNDPYTFTHEPRKLSIIDVGNSMLCLDRARQYYFLSRRICYGSANCWSKEKYVAHTKAHFCQSRGGVVCSDDDSAYLLYKRNIGTYFTGQLIGLVQR